MKLGKNAAQVRTDSPGAYFQHRRNCFVRISLCHHARNFAFTWTARHIVFGPLLCSHNQAPHSINLGVQQNVTAFILAMNLRARAMSRLDNKPFEELVEERA